MSKLAECEDSAVACLIAIEKSIVVATVIIVAGIDDDDEKKERKLRAIDSWQK